MTRLLDEALSAVLLMPEPQQDEIARGIIAMARSLSDKVGEASAGWMSEPFRLWPRRRPGAIRER